MADGDAVCAPMVRVQERELGRQGCCMCPNGVSEKYVARLSIRQGSDSMVEGRSGYLVRCVNYLIKSLIMQLTPY